MASIKSLNNLVSTSLYDLSGLVALVTGGGSGIGLMIAEGFAANGAKVYITGRREGTLKDSADDVNNKILEQNTTATGGCLIPVVLDVTDRESIRNIVRHVEEIDGKLHILVNNAGQVGPFSSILNKPEASEHPDLGKEVFENEDFEGWADLFSINITPIFFMTMGFLSLLEKGAQDLDTRISRGMKHTTSIINITSVSGIQRQAQGHFAYNVSKAAANHLTRLLSTELALKKKPIRVNAIAPGPFATEMTDHQGLILSEEVANMIGKGISPIPAKRGGRDEEIAAAALYLASPNTGGYTNGQILLLDGGFLLVNPGST